MGICTGNCEKGGDTYYYLCNENKLDIEIKVFFHSKFRLSWSPVV